ncbi:5'-nucleotidase C-terminal domain-containing protein [Trueperella pecoris]|uniref:5'-nucleotidase C-terminal domain-containing protein n=1 Tax=Trueperella pecoris TaxID=2733571 RepID=UPI001ABEBB12|nr:5'-nucleotidase C-terminal domain-containing protein [Trueperella pecoris]QTG74862.1 5'-nucleotidase C-terminal domain-containing protein [Trueperella pecoris]
MVINNETCATSATALDASDYLGREDAGVKKTIEPWHSKTVEWVSTVVATATEDMTAERAKYEDTAIVDFINLVQQETVKKALADSTYKDLPVLSQASPFSSKAKFTKGDVTIADMAGLYTFDNTLFGVEMTGKQMKDYLEWSARFYVQQPEEARSRTGPR